MELKPVPKKALPKYVAALAVISSAALLIGCQTAGEVQFEGVAPAPLELSGDVAITETDQNSCCTTKSEMQSSTPANSITTTLPLALSGDVAITETDQNSCCTTESEIQP